MGKTAFSGLLRHTALTAPDLTTHEREIGEQEAEQGEGDQAGQLGPDNQQALTHWQWSWDGTMELLHGKGSDTAYRGHQQRRGDLAEQFARHDLYHQEFQFLVDVYRRRRGKITWFHALQHQVHDHGVEYGEEQPDGDAGQGRGRRLPETNRKKDREVQPECHIDDAQYRIKDDPQELFRGGRDSQGDKS